ncbi:MAG: glycosyltransferase family 39 protein, partial [Anaerolineae bacterium]|nr:glycosyltransferase family 39 protein [Anaerolineae bacterium]
MKQAALFQTPTTTRHPLTWVLFALLCLFILAMHTYHFEDRNYRQDEAWRAHLALEYPLNEVVTRSARNLDPPLWQIVLDIWVAAFGHTEHITRFSSTLFTALALAFTFRLASDLFNQRIGLLAVFLLGTLAFFQFYMHETRPYSLLVLSTTAAHLCFLRWLRRPNFRYALGFVLAGIVAIYTHFYGLFFIAVLAFYFVLAVRWQRDLYLRTLGLFIAIGLSFLGWILPFVHAMLVVVPGGIAYSLEPTGGTLLNNLAYLYGRMNIRPPELSHVILILGLIVPLTLVLPRPQARRPFRFGAAWPRVQIIAIPAILLILAFVSNEFVSSLTPRNLV